MISKLATSALKKNEDLRGSFKVKIYDTYFVFSGPLNLEHDFNFIDKDYQYNVKSRKMEPVSIPCVMALNSKFRENYSKVTLGIGFLLYIYSQYNDLLDDESRINILNHCKFDLETNLYDLYPTQQEDLRLLFHYKRGILQCFTGYGKTQVISVLMDYILNVLKEPLVVLVPDTKPKHELVSRYKEITGSDLPDYYDPDSNINVLMVKGFLRSNSFNPDDEYFKRVKWVLADEVEYCINNSGIQLMSLFINADKWFGFSATPDKKSGNRIWIDNTKSPVITRNFDLIHFFGFSTVFRKPDSHRIKVVDIVTSKFSYLKDMKPNSYQDALKTVFTSKDICNFVKSIAKQESPLFIPFFLLEVIDNWIENYFNDEGFSVINICGRGYELYESGKLVDNKLDLDQVKDLIEGNKVNVITGTSAVYRALDFKGISNILPLTSKSAGIVIQSIGRIARDVNFKIICIDPTDWIPVYSSDLMKRKKLIKDYYSECKIVRENKSDIDYGVV